MLTHRRFLTEATQASVGLSLAPSALAQKLAEHAPVLVNDVHSQLSPIYVHDVVAPEGMDELRASVQRACETGGAVSISGGRHAVRHQDTAGRHAS